jgi:hypothetical protein
LCLDRRIPDPGAASGGPLEDALKTEVVKQYAHTWRVFERPVADFDADAWIGAGRGAVLPARLSLHILHSVKYYREDTTEYCFPSGKSIEVRWESAPEKDLPSREDVAACIRVWRDRTERWIADMDFASPNRAFPWAGETKFGVVLFALRHFAYHLGELSSLLNESKKGEAQDHYVKAMEG